ncbi:MAG TPA: hypothetical protein VF779_07650 [Pyrinomonadaceae bacterium]
MRDAFYFTGSRAGSFAPLGVLSSRPKEFNLGFVSPDVSEPETFLQAARRVDGVGDPVTCL